MGKRNFSSFRNATHVFCYKHCQSSESYLYPVLKPQLIATGIIHFLLNTSWSNIQVMRIMNKMVTKIKCLDDKQTPSSSKDETNVKKSTVYSTCWNTFIFYCDIKLCCSLIFKVLNYWIFIMLNTQYLKNYFLIASWYTTLIRVVTFSVSQSSRSISHVSPPVRESKAVLDSGFHAVDSWFQVLNSDSLSVEIGFRIPIVSGFLDSLNCIPDSKAQDSEFRTP